MSEQIVTEITARGVRYEAGPLKKRHWGEWEYASLVTVRAGDVEGHALARTHYATPPRGFNDLIQAVQRPLIGRSVDDWWRDGWPSLLMWTLAQSVPVFVLSALDVAMWDLRGKIAGSPVNRMLSPDASSTVDAYASIPVYTDVGECIEKSAEVLSEGHTGVKLHTSSDLDRDLDICAALREHFPGAAFMLDASRALTLDQAKHVAAVLEECEYAWFEEPLNPFDYNGHRQLRESVSIPIVGYETVGGTPYAHFRAIDADIFDAVMIDAYWRAGITGTHQVIEYAESVGHDLAFHHGASASMNLANIHLASASKSTKMVELFTPASEHGLAANFPPVGFGGIAVPTTPGLGLELDWDFLDHHWTN